MILKAKSDSLVKIDNTLLWGNHAKPFFETYYLKTNDREGAWSLWLRYILCTSSLYPEGTAYLTACFSDKAGKRLALKQQFDLQTHDVMHNSQLVSIEGSCLSLAEATGSVTENKQNIEWALLFEDPVISLRLYPDLLYSLPFPKTKFVEPRLSGFVTGSFYVNGFKHELQRNRAYQAHVYGNALPKKWAWANCIDFEEDEEAYFEAFFIQDKFSKFPTPSLCFCCINIAGEEWISNSISKILWGNKSSLEADSWELTFSKSNYRFQAFITRHKNLSIASKMTGPDDEIRHCEHTAMAEIEIKVFRKQRGSWVLAQSLSSKNKCAFETGTGEDPV